MENILLPSKMTFSEGEGENEQVLTIEPLHHGYGTTVGNALRRVLLSSLEGAAVTAVKIKGVQHEFATVDGVKEDMLEVVLNLKKLRLKVHTDEPVVLKLEVSGKPGAVTAKDISANADVEVVNTDLVIATRTNEDTLTMELTVERGRGFSPTEKRESHNADIGLIQVDAMFSPVVNASLNVENTRVGEITNYDKLIMRILTDGTITPQEAVEHATKTILNHFNWIEGQLSNASLTERIVSASEEEETAPESTEETAEETAESTEE